MGCFFLKASAAAVVGAVLAAAASYVSVAPPLPGAGIFSSPTFLWVAANVIVVWLFLSSFRQHRTAAARASAAFAWSHADADADDDVSAAAMSGLYPSSEHVNGFAAAVASEEAVADVAPVSNQPPREPRAARRADRPRVRKKSAGEETPRAVAAAEAMSHRKNHGEEGPRTVAVEAKPGEEWPRIVAAEAKPREERPRTVAAAEAKPDRKNKPGEGGPSAASEANPDDDADESMDSMWLAIVRSGAARPVAVPKSETWSSDELPRMERAAKRAAARREMRKSASLVPSSPPHPAAAAQQPGWRTRDVLVMAQDELLRRAESLIRRHHEHQRLQRQESEQRQAVEHERLRALARLIRV